MSALPYIVEVQICLMALWIVYRAAMHRRGRLSLNRLWLLSMAGLALLIPALSIPLWPAPQLVAMPMGWAGPMQQAAVALRATRLDWRWVYLAGVALLLIASVVQLIRLQSIIRSASASVRVGSVECLQTERIGRAATFLNRILINPRQLSAGELAQIVAHERAHVALGHGYDLLLAQGFCIAMWWNPFVWLWRQSLREVHEFQADAAVLAGGFDSSDYARLILQSLSGMRAGFINGFSYLTLKNRLVMIKKQQRGACARLLFALPVVAGLMTLFSLSAQEAQTIDPVHVTGYGDPSSPDAKSTGETTPLIFIDGIEASKEELDKLPSEQVERIEVLKDASATARYGERGKDGVILITLKKEAGPRTQ